MNRDRLLQIAGGIHDVLVATLAFYSAYAIYYGVNRVFDVSRIHQTALLFVASAAASFFIFSLNRGSWRYASVPELVAIIKASGATVIIFTVALFLLSRGNNLPRPVPPLTFLFLITGLGAPRLGYRLLKEQGYFPYITRGRADTGQNRNVILYGSNGNAESFIRAVRRSEKTPVRIHGIVDDGGRIGMSIQGVSLLGRARKLPDLVAKFKQRGIEIMELVVTDHGLSREAIGNLVSIANACGLKVTQIPNIADIGVLDEKMIEPNPIRITDLLGRAEVHIDTKMTEGFVKGKKLLITGAGGSIGSELVRQVALFNPGMLVLTDISEHLLYLIDTEIREKFPHLEVVTKIADVRDRTRIDKLLGLYKPDVVFHAAALKHVPLMENNILESMKTNVLGARNMAECAVAHGVGTFVFISTDKAVNPTNIMGATKRAAEAYCQFLDLQGSATRFRTVRFGNVLGSNGSVVPRFEAQIARGGPVTVTHPDIARYFMTIPEAAKLVLQASAHGLPTGEDRGSIHILDMGNPVRIADLAVKMIELAGYRPHIDIEIAYTNLRPGEKLREELFATDEEVSMVREQGYMLAHPRVVEQSVIRAALTQIETAIERANEAKAVDAIRLVVPEYMPPQAENAAKILILDPAKKKLA